MNWERLWYTRPNWRVALLAPISFLYCLVVRVWHLLFDVGLRRAQRVSARVVSVGNLVVGGAGKTPVVIHLARAATTKGRRVAVLTRGYARRNSALVDFTAASMRPSSEVGDEARLIARSCPGVTVWVGSDRVESARRAVAAGADLLILDDGFQHRRLHRDVNVLVDAGEGNGWCLPAGPLREPARGRRRATVIWGRDGRPGDIEANHMLSGVLRADGTRGPLSELSARPLVLLTAIARPARLIDQLRAAGAEIAAQHLFPDHHTFTQRELDAVKSDAERRGAVVITTAKDAERLSIPVMVVEQVVELMRGSATLDAML